jgi:hypothetical protein
VLVVGISDDVMKSLCHARDSLLQFAMLLSKKKVHLIKCGWDAVIKGMLGGVMCNVVVNQVTIPLLLHLSMRMVVPRT